MTAGLPRGLLEVLPVHTARTWVLLRDSLPESLVLYGGTALAAHLHHRVSRDLDFFSARPLDVSALRAMLESVGTFAVTTDEADTLNGVFNDTKVQFLRVRDQDAVEPPVVVAGIPVASLRDIAATKLKTIADRGELRDYFDLMTIEQHTAITIEAVLQDYQERYRTRDRNTLLHIIRALGTFSDVIDDPGLPASRVSIERYWTRRVRTLVLSVDTTGTVATQPAEPGVLASSAVPPVTPAASSSGPGAGRVWVEAHERNGRLVQGYWRRR